MMNRYTWQHGCPIVFNIIKSWTPYLSNPKKRKNESRLEEEIKVPDNWSRFIVLKSSESCIRLTKLSPFVIETSLNLLSLKLEIRF